MPSQILPQRGHKARPPRTQSYGEVSRTCRPRSLAASRRRRTFGVHGLLLERQRELPGPTCCRPRCSSLSPERVTGTRRSPSFLHGLLVNLGGYEDATQMGCGLQMRGGRFVDMQRTSCKQQQEMTPSLLDGPRISDGEATQEGHDRRAAGDVP